MEGTKATTSDTTLLLKDLPTDTIPPTTEEKEILTWLYNPTEKAQSSTKTLVLEFRGALVLAVVFVLFSIPVLDPFLQSLLPFTQHPWILLLIKAIFFALTAWILMNSSLLFRSSSAA